MNLTPEEIADEYIEKYYDIETCQYLPVNRPRAPVTMRAQSDQPKRSTTPLPKRRTEDNDFSSFSNPAMFAAYSNLLF